MLGVLAVLIKEDPVCSQGDREAYIMLYRNLVRGGGESYGRIHGVRVRAAATKCVYVTHFAIPFADKDHLHQRRI